MLRSARAAGAALAAFSIVLAPMRSARAWVEVHVEADDVRIAVEKTGDARVEHKVTFKIAGGPLRAFDIRGVDADAAPDPEGYVVPEREASRGSLASAVQAVAERLPVDARPRADGSAAPTVVRVRFDREKGLGRGVYVLFVRYATHLRPRPEPHSSVFSRVEWRGPVWDDGFDSARVTFDLPAAATEPRVADQVEGADPGSRPPLVLSTVHRGAERDRIELLRPYAPKGEAIPWAIRADARALQPPPPPAPARAKTVRSVVDAALAGAAHRGLFVAGALALFVMYSALVALKSAEVARAAARAGTTARPFVPLPSAVRAVFAGALLVAGLFVELVIARATLGAVVVLGAVLLAAHRTPRSPRASLRRPGRWLPIPTESAFADPPRFEGAYLDVSTRAGKAIFALLLASLAALVGWLYETSPYQAELVAFDVAALLAIFCTGRLAELPPDPARSPSRFLRDVARRVRKAFPDDDVRLVGRIRIPDGQAHADELRLGVAPRGAVAGFGAIEVGVVYVPGAGGALALPEIILRLKQGSPCEALLERLMRHGHSVRGRSNGERAILYTPRLPTARMTAAIVVALVRAQVATRPATAVGLGSSARRAA
jgi:hypothetical protein